MSEIMTITIDVPSETETELRKRAKRNGQDFDQFLRNLLVREAEPTLTDMLRPLREETKRLGLTEDELEDLIDSEIAEYRLEHPLVCR